MIYSFDPKEVNLIYAGVRITGFADGTFIKLEFNSDRYALTMGADGLGARSKSNDKSGKLTVTLMPNSVGNKVFASAMALDDATNAGALPFALDDPSSGDKFVGLGAWVMKDPGREFGKEISNKEWVLETDTIISIHGAAL